MEFYDFPDIGNVIIPTDFHSIIFQRGWSTTNQLFTILERMIWPNLIIWEQIGNILAV